jgi:DNA-binding IclR family transcriptional regulator
MKKYLELQHLIERADRLICLKATGTASEFAITLGISRATLFRLLQFFREMDMPIKYCKYRKTYYYEYPVKLSISHELYNLELIKR